tara:strand:+ start:151 stop:318 length:168 start_codon:yes stop_codon:yes gene_type:complete
MTLRKFQALLIIYALVGLILLEDFPRAWYDFNKLVFLTLVILYVIFDIVISKKEK